MDKFGYAFASGMAAIDATLRLVKAGEHVVVSDNTYGGTFRLFTKVLANYNIEFDFVDTSDALNVEAAIKPNTKMVFVETPTNPVMIVSDLRQISEVAHRAGARVVCDNTFLSPYLQRPLEFGVDIVVHSTTKYLNGHSDGIGGIVILNDEEDADWIGFIQNGAGRNPFAFGFLAGDARHENAGAADGATRQIRPRSCCISRRASESEKDLLSRVSVAPAARPGKAPAKRFWRNDRI